MELVSSSKLRSVSMSRESPVLTAIILVRGIACSVFLMQNFMLCPGMVSTNDVLNSAKSNC